MSIEAQKLLVTIFNSKRSGLFVSSVILLQAAFTAACEGKLSVHVSSKDPATFSSASAPAISIDENNFTNTDSVNLTLIAPDNTTQMKISNTSNCSSGTWESFATSKSNWKHGVQNGSVTVSVKYRDAAGNESICVSDSVTHDNLAPDVTVDFDISTNVPFVPALTVIDDHDVTYAWSKVSGPGNLTFGSQSNTPEIAASMAGDYVIAVVVTDAANNSTTKHLNFHWFDGFLGLYTHQNIWDNPAPVLKLANPLPMPKAQFFDNSSCSGVPLKEVDTSPSITEAQILLPTTGDYTFYAKYEGAKTCMTSGLDYKYVRQISPGVTVTTVYAAAFGAFAALYSNGMVITWGNLVTGGDSTMVASRLDGSNPVVSITAADEAFAAIHADGSVTTWGRPGYGGDSSAVATRIDGTIDVVSITATKNAFAAIHADGSVTTWGDAGYGGDSSAVASDLDGNNDVTSITATSYAFAAIHADGSVTTWGDAIYGGDSSAVASDLDGNNDVTGITAALYAFAAIHADGSVTTWGRDNSGGDSSAVAADLNGTIDVVSITANRVAFAGIHADGSVTTWGSSNHGGNSGAVASDLDGTNAVVSIAASAFAFAALHVDGSVTTWGNSMFGGDSSAVASRLDGATGVTSIKA